MITAGRSFKGLICCLLVIALSACGSLAERSDTNSTEVLFDTSLDKIAGGLRLAPREEQWDGFGEAVDVHGDVLVVGAPERNHFGKGSAYVYRLTDGEWREEAQLIASDRDEFNELALNRGCQSLGSSLAVEDGIIAVGAPGNLGPANTNTGCGGAVYIFEYSGQAWVETAKLTPSQMDQDKEQNKMEWLNHHNRKGPRTFGALVALSGDTLAVGGDAGGLVYIYQRGNTGWQEQAHITIPGMSGRYLYTSFLSLFGDTLAVSVFYLPLQPERPSLLTGNVIVYIYERTGNSWEESFRFVPDGGKLEYLFPMAINIGASVALGGDSGRVNRLVVGLPGFPDWTASVDVRQIWENSNVPFPKPSHQTGEVYIFERSKNGRWSQRAILKPTGWDNPPGPGSIASMFPSHLEEEPNDFDVAAFLDTHIYPGHLYSETPEISFFGATVALDGNRLAVTSGFANATYIFKRINGDWVYQFSLKPKNEKVEVWEDYTQDVSLSDHTLLLGTPSEFGNSAYVFDLCVPAMLDCR